jgi:hypothetical protein
MQSASVSPSPRTVTIDNPSTDLADADGIKTSVGTETTAQTYTGADLDGANANPGPALPAPGGYADLTQYPSVTTTTQANAYNTTDPIVFVGTFGGIAVERSALLTAAGGNETIVADGPIEQVSEVRVPAQLLDTGTFTFGLSGIGPFGRARGEIVQSEPWRTMQCTVAGTLHVQYAGGYDDTIPASAGESYPSEPIRIYADSTAEFILYQ